MLEEWLNDPVVDLAIDMLFYAIFFWIGYDNARGKFQNMNTMKFASLYTRIMMLEAVRRKYVPYWNHKKDVKRWQDPRTGEFVDHDDVCIEVKILQQQDDEGWDLKNVAKED